MGTRATYKFITRYEGTQTFYIHFDGYPEGASEYFKPCLSNFTAEGFLRSNGEARFTDSHESHGGTEYRYTINQMNTEGGLSLLTVLKKCWSEDGDSWEKYYQGTVADFCERFAPKEEIEEIITTPKIENKSFLELLQ